MHFSNFGLLPDVTNPEPRSICREKKGFWTYKRLPGLAMNKIFIGNISGKCSRDGFLEAHHAVFSSADQDWNNAHFFYVAFSEPTKEYDHKGYGTITHPGGDQTFIEFVGKMVSSVPGTLGACESKGVFIDGTGTERKRP